ncbi:Putative Sirtuin family NAD-dependent deacetylase [Desulfonema limicola]|uniref:protein acetyllysine N-acetyltransferase n=1 Tax=Desulfonema limicola TaxID=45656 RepID=A0A975B6A0_9BACT|nr:NAD-dependent deacylase [Desulfonema limicola]QTA79561.1 Putative Sirtuin family NAD-dependent deacetylase [Desulfonema limicola]
MQDIIKQAAKDIFSAKKAVALTGAGISVESGIPPFRGKGGIWEKFDPMTFGHIDTFEKNPAQVWKILIKDLKEIIDQAKPNDGHKGLAVLEKMGILKTIITQNVDGLHQMAGNTDVIEFHGNCAWQRCMDCGRKIKTAEVDISVMPPRCQCSGILRPDWVFFGESIPMASLHRSQQIASACDLMLVIGTSAIVQPAAYMPVIAKENGAKIIEINPEATPLTGKISAYLVKGKAGQVMNEILKEMEQLI